MIRQLKSSPLFTRLYTTRISPAMTKYSFGKTVNLPFNEAVDKATAALAAEGFGVPVTMDLQQIFKAKINKASRIGTSSDSDSDAHLQDTRPYKVR